MERLTKRDETGKAVFLRWMSLHSCEVCERLAAYEDTGLEPEEIAAQTRANKEGRVVVLPCRAGDTVYFETYTKNATVSLGVQPHKVSVVDTRIVVPAECTDVGLPLHLCGVTWFLTREEAEAALERQKGW